METHPHLQPEQLQHIFQNDIVSLTVGQTGSCSLYRQDYESLLGKRWLRTGVLDLGLKLLVEQHKEEARKVFAMRGEFNQDEHAEYVKLMDAFIATLIMGSEDDFILQSLKPLNLFSPLAKYLIIPLNTEYAHGSHWLLALLQNGNFRDSAWKLWVFDSAQSSQYIGRTLCKKLEKLYSVFESAEDQS